MHVPVITTITLHQFKSPFMLNYLSIPSTQLNAQNSTCIFLHGLGDSGNGWASVARLLSRKLPLTKFILPHA